MITLRDYQQSGYDQIRSAWLSCRNVLYVAPCRSGKTVVMAKTIEDNSGRTVVLAHRGELIQQLSMTLARNGIRHNIIGTPSLARACAHNHVAELGRSFTSPHAGCHLSSAQTLVRIKKPEPWMLECTLWITDEGHHYHNDNVWTKALDHFPNARGLSVTATPIGAGGKGLGRHHDGVIDQMVLGPTSRELIERGFLTDYRIYAPPSDLDLSNVTIGASGDFTPVKLAEAVHKSHITGDIVQHYLRVAPGKLGMTFATDIESAIEIARAYKAAGVPAEAISGKTPPALRRELQRRHQNNELKQLVSVDIFGEGIDVPNLEVVSFGRPTASLGLYIQQFWRPGNPRPDKPHFIVLDHVSNVARFGLPDAPRVWSLDRKDRKTRGRVTDAIPVRTCPNCLAVFERIYQACPYCNHRPEPASRSSIEAVDGVLAELTPATLALMRGEVDRPCVIPYGATPVIEASVRKRYRERQAAQESLRATMASWGGWRTIMGDTLAQQQARFWHTFGVDVLTAQALGRAEADDLRERITNHLTSSSNSGTLPPSDIRSVSQ